MPTSATTLTEGQLDLTFAALADPTRRAMLARLATADATVNELAAPFDLSLQAISKHLKVLERSGLISRARHAQFRPCHLEPGTLDTAVEWIQTHRKVWTERFDKLEQHLHDLQSPPSPTAGAAGPREQEMPCPIPPRPPRP